MSVIGVTGASGFIAGWVIDELLARGHEVVAFDRIEKQNFRKDVDFVLGDVRDNTAVFEFAAHVNGIIHLAAVLGTQETISAPKPSAETNILGSLNVFEAANRYDLPVVYAGVGNHFMRLEGTGSYTISKSAAEDYARMFNLYRDGNIAIVRPVNAYGPRQSVAQPFGSSKVRKIMPSFICRALIGADIEVYGDGTQISDCVYVADVASAFVNALEYIKESAKPLNRPIEVGPEVSYSVNEIVNFIVKKTASNSRVVHLPMRAGEIPNSIVRADVNTLYDIRMDAYYFVTLSDGLDWTIDYYRKYLIDGGMLS